MTPAVTERERLALVALSQLWEPGDLQMARLTAEFGAVTLYDRVIAQHLAGEVHSDIAARLVGLDPERDLDQADRLGIRFVVPGDPEWPHRLSDLDLADPVNEVGAAPLGLWVRGPLRLDEIQGGIAVVGARSSTSYGEDVARDLAAAATRAGRCVISGAAYGIDQAAHRGALAAGGPTVAVLACGADRAYPAAHHALLEHVRRDGAVVAEVAPGCAPLRPRFLSRNRVIAALGVGTVVVEAAVRSGALNTATWSSRLNRVLMGVPGSVTSATSQGVHHLIRTGAAALVTNGPDLLELVGAVGSDLTETPRAAEKIRDRLTRRERQVLESVPVARGARSDAVARTAGIGILEVRRTLGTLESKGLVRVDDGGWRLAAKARD